MPSGQEQLTGGVKHDESKRRMDLIPVSLLNGLAKVLEFGAKKYGDNNWRKGLAWSRVYAALQRHLTDFWAGEDIDPESRLPHLYHAACNLAFLIEYFEKNKDLDDRIFHYSLEEGFTVNELKAMTEEEYKRYLNDV